MRVALVTVYSHAGCTLKDVAGGYGTVFRVGQSLPARLLERAKAGIAHLPSPTLGYLAAIAKAAGHDVSTHEIFRIPGRWDEVPSVDLAIVLSSIVDVEAERTVLEELARAGAHTVACGAYATTRPIEYLGPAHAVVRGEPEALGAALYDRALTGIVDAGFVEDLDALPRPDWSVFPVERYRYALLTRRGPTLPIQSARGCAYGCDYCPFRVTAPFRERSAASVIEEAHWLVRRHGARALSFRDPLLNFDRDRVLTLAEGIAPLDIRFGAEMRADRLDDELLVLLHRAGLRSLELGVESVDREMLARHKRTPPSTEDIERVVATAHRLGVRVIANFMFGLPDDGEDAIRATVAWAKRLNTFAVQFTVATPYPGTTLETQVAGQMTTRRAAALTGWEPAFEHTTLTAPRIRALREWAYVSYHFRPSYVARFATQAARALLE